VDVEGQFDVVAYSLAHGLELFDGGQDRLAGF